MKTSAFLPIGKVGSVKTELIEKGDVLVLETGETVSFLEMKQKFFIAKDHNTGKNFRIPKWRIPNTLPFISEKVGRKDKTVLTKSAKPSNLKYGEMFALEGKKETFMFLENTSKRGGKPIMKAIDLATGRTFNIGEGFTIVKINVAKIKRENKVNA